MRNTILINKENKWKEKYEKYHNLIECKDIDNNKILIEEKSYLAYLELKDFLDNKNIEIGITSAYRSTTDQEKLRQELLETRGKDYIKCYVAEKDESEHTTGLAIDIAVLINGQYEDDTEEAYKLLEQIHTSLKDFGFILRYPKEKEKITGYNYEPWHIRYVGKIPANIIMNNNLTLEEYLKTYSAILYVNKEKGKTSYDIVNEISKLFGIKKVGHTGTLDPLAEGVLIVCIGEACKIVELLTAEDKEYEAEVELGILTDTLDITGNIIDKKEIPSDIDLEKILSCFKKTYLQEVPIYSSIKVNGKKLYEYAREQKEVILPKKEVTIKEIKLLNKKDNTFTFKALVSKGCYIRSLIRDIGEVINTCATMTSLIRTKQGKIKLEDTNTLDEIRNMNAKIHSIEEVLNYQVITVDKETEFKIKNGITLYNEWNIKDKCLFKNKKGTLLGIYQVKGNHLKTWKNLRNDL